jgi:site-specific DNA-methyltransferase (cytosine-N4-specific)
MRPQFPSQAQLLFPTLDAVADAGGSAPAREVADRVASCLHLSPEAREAHATIAGAPVNLWDRHIRWVRQQAVRKGLLEGSTFNLWKLSEDGENVLRNARPGVVITVFETDAGIALWSEAEAAAAVIEDGSVQCIVTSPPFALLRKKDYANQKPAREHVAWLTRFFGIVKPKLTPNGSLFLNVADAWQPGQPTLEPWTDRLLLSLMDECGYFLAEKLYWHSRSKMPAPAEWVTVKRIRVTPAVEEIFWLSNSPHPYADNRNVLRPYSESMKQRIAAGGERRVDRPSGYALADGAFSKDNGGSIAHNLIEAANTSSNDAYQSYVRANGLLSHPARFPEALPDFAIRLSTRPGDLVWDPFSGSFVTAAVAERLGRRWIGNEKSLNYTLGGRGRFPMARMLIDLSAADLSARRPGIFDDIVQ